LMMDRPDSGTEAKLSATRDHCLRALLPQLPGTQGWILECADQRLHVSTAEQGVPYGGEERELANALCRPIGPYLRARNSPDLFRVGLEERAVQPLAEAVDDPVLQRLLALSWKEK